MWRTTVIALTGSVGKTTAKEALAAVLEPLGPTLKTHQNQNDQLGVVRTLRRLRPWHRYAVIEVGTEGPGDVARSARLVKPHVAIVLSVARTHTNRFRTLDDTANEKAQLLQSLSPRRGVAILNADDALVRAMADACRARVVLFGRSAECEYRASNVDSSWPRRLGFDVEWRSERARIDTQLVGAHWLGSVLAVLAASRELGIGLDTAANRVAAVAPFMGRMQPVALPSGAIAIRDEQNGSTDTFDAMFEVLQRANARRRGLIISDLSDWRAKPKVRQRELGKRIAAHCDFALFVGEHGSRAVSSAVDAGMDPARCMHFGSLREAASWLARTLGPGDLVFLKGRMADHVSRVVFAQFGEIGCWKTSCGFRRLCDVCPNLAPSFELRDALRPVAPMSMTSDQIGRMARNGRA